MLRAMVKRVVAALLWFYITWVLWNVVAYATGVSIFFGPVLGFAAAAVIAGDPFKVIWKPSESVASARRRTLARSASTAAAK
jgi:hypothetical protein